MYVFITHPQKTMIPPDQDLDRKSGESIAVVIGSALTAIGLWFWRSWRKPKESGPAAWEMPGQRT
jgi:hypothetical protein